MLPSTRLSAGTAALIAAGLSIAQAQDIKIGGDVQIWYTQMLNDNLRLNSAPSFNGGKGYYNLRDEFKENTFTIRRTEIKLSGRIVDDVEYEVMLDPSIKTDPAKEPTILQDAFIKYTFAPGFELKVGQFKTLQTMEGNISSTELLFAERSQLGRVFGDKRDRGAVLSASFGDPKEFGAKVSLGAFNGMTDTDSKGKTTDSNAQKDLVLRFDFNVGREHRFGAYTLQGSTDQADKTGQAAAANPGGLWPSQATVYDNKDRTTNVGCFYQFENESWIANAECITGLLGRRFGTFGSSVKREHLDQKFMGYYMTGGYKTGAHTFLLRYDTMNYNSGDQWYTAYNPYKESAAGVTTGTDYTPKYTETSLGYTYAFKPDKVKAANLKVNYIMRSKNFLAPLKPAGQTREQGGDSLLLALQVAF